MFFSAKRMFFFSHRSVRTPAAQKMFELRVISSPVLFEVSRSFNGSDRWDLKRIDPMEMVTVYTVNTEGHLGKMMGIYNHQTFRWYLKMEESENLFKLYGNSLCKGKPTPKIAL